MKMGIVSQCSSFSAKLIVSTVRVYTFSRFFIQSFEAFLGHSDAATLLKHI